MVKISACLLLAAAAWGQQPAFDVASVRPVQGGRSGGGGRGLGLPFLGMPANIQAAPGSLTMRAIRFRAAVAWAYGVREFQVAGPETW
jgi:uncharacterized protein (TIGR03435 family)